MLSKVWTAFLLFGAAASVVAWIAALCHEKGIRPFAGAVRFVRGLPWGGRLALLPLFLALVAYGSTKMGEMESKSRVEVEGEGVGEGVVVGQGEGERVGESISNHVERVDRVDGGESDYLAQSPQSPQSGDSDNVANVEMFPITNTNSQLETGTGNWQHSHTGNIQQGNISTLATLTTSYSQLTTFNSELITPTVCEDWLKFGGFEDWIYLGPGGWSFRHGSNFVERLAVFSSGKIRLLKQGGGDAWIALSAVPVSIVPEANWGMLNFRCRDVGEGEVQGEVVDVGGESISNHVERVDRVDGGESDYLAQSPQSGDSDNVANVEMLPIANTNSQLETGTGNWQHSHTGNIQQGNIHTLATLTTYNSQLTTLNSELITPNSSLFWHAETPSNTLLLTWCNALLNRDTNSPVNIQAELFPSGVMRITHDLSGELVTEHVPAPELPCADTLDEVLARIEVGNSNAYFFADVAVAKGPAVVKVKSGRETTLGDYSFVAHPGVTNRLPFLIGPEYEVKSEAAYSHFSVTNIEVAVSNLTDRLAAVQWPVKIDFGEGYDFGGGKLFEVAVDPPFLDGIMEFDGNANGNMRMLPRSSGGCGCVVSVTNGAVTVTGVCSNDTCVHEGSYVYEGYRERIELECGMDSDEDPEPEPDDPSSPEEENEPSASVWFEEKAVIFEDEYENAPGETVPRRSTRTKLKCTAYGGERGGNLTVDLSGMDALRLVSGTPPSGRTLAPGEYVEFEAEYEAEKASLQENGTVAKVSFAENETNITFDDEDKMTVVEVEVTSVAIKPLNCRNRHIYGICEEVQISWRPMAFNLNWDNNGKGKWSSREKGMWKFQCDDHTCQITLRTNVSGVSYEVFLSCIEPSSIECSVVLEFISRMQLGYGEAGDVGMNLIFTVCPTTVSFNNVRFKEVSSTMGNHTGYFGMSGWQNFWYHTPAHGADEIVELNEDNDGSDVAYMGLCPPPWSAGLMTWEIPAVWQPPLDSGSSKPAVQFAQYLQQFQIDANGTVVVSKFGHVAERGTNTVKKIDGVIVE